MPATEALLDRFRAAHTQVLGVSVDSMFSHAHWGQSLGGISFPLLADFHPKGQMAQAYGVYLDGAGITDRATVVIDSQGVVQHASSVTPAGERNIEELAALCEEIDRKTSGPKEAFPAAQGVAGDAALFVKNRCGFSSAALAALDNLHLKIKVKNVSEKPAAAEELRKQSGADTAPCLLLGGKALGDTAEILRTLADRVAPVR